MKYTVTIKAWPMWFLMANANTNTRKKEISNTNIAAYIYCINKIKSYKKRNAKTTKYI